MRKSAQAIYDALCNDEGWITRDAFINHMEHNIWEETGPSQDAFNATGAPRIRRHSLDDLDFKINTDFFMEIGFEMVKIGKEKRRIRKEAEREVEMTKEGESE